MDVDEGPPACADGDAALALSLPSLPPHLLCRVLSLLDRASLVSAANVCVALFDAACAVAPAPRDAASPCDGVEAALRTALCRTMRTPPAFLALHLRPGPSAFQAELPLAGLGGALELVLRDAAAAEAAPAGRRAPPLGEPADRWLLGLLASPAAALAAESAAAGRAPCQADGLGPRVAALASRARAAVLCARSEHGVVRLQLRPVWLAAAALRAARAAAATPAPPPQPGARAWLVQAYDPFFFGHPDSQPTLQGVLAFLLLPHELADMRHRRAAALADAACILEAPAALRSALAAAGAAPGACADVASDDVELALRLGATLRATSAAQAAPGGAELQAALQELGVAVRLARDACAAARPRTPLGGEAATPLPPPRRALLAAAATALQRVADVVVAPLAATLERTGHV